MYIDIDMGKYNGKYKMTIFRNGIAEHIVSKDMNLLTHYVKNIAEYNDGETYVDNRGCGKYLTDCLDKENVKYIPFVHSHQIDLDKFIKVGG